MIRFSYLVNLLLLNKLLLSIIYVCVHAYEVIRANEMQSCFCRYALMWDSTFK